MIFATSLVPSAYTYATPNFLGQAVPIYGATYDAVQGVGLNVVGSSSPAPAFAYAIEVVFYTIHPGSPDRDHLINQTDATSIFADIGDFTGATYETALDTPSESKLVERWLQRVRFDVNRYRRDLVAAGWDVGYDGDFQFREGPRDLAAGTAPSTLLSRPCGSIIFGFNGEGSNEMTVAANVITTAVNTAIRQNSASLPIVFG